MMEREILLLLNKTFWRREHRIAVSASRKIIGSRPRRFVKCVALVDRLC